VLFSESKYNLTSIILTSIIRRNEPRQRGGIVTRDGRCGVQFPAGTTDFSILRKVQTDSKAQPAFYSWELGIHLFGSKAAVEGR
jgi:hypothetical protein